MNMSTLRTLIVSTSYDIIGMDTSTLHTLICIKLVIILLEWIKYIAYNDIDQLIRIMFEWTCVLCVQWYGLS
jgi:hypothetical protein